MKRIAALAAAVVLVAAPALADEVTVYTFDGSFDDAAFGVESAITDRGLVIDYVSHVGEMLERTRQDVGSDVVLFEEADIFIFCSALLSRQVMEDDPMNISHCPYGIFVAEMGGEVMIGYRNKPEGSMQVVQELLDEIAREAAGI